VIIEEVTADDVSEETEPTNRESATQMLEEQLDELLSSTDDDIALEEVAPEFDAKNEDEIDLLSGEDGVRMKLDLARAYIEMGDAEGAKDIITEVMESQDDDHLQEAQAMLDSL
jgi:pilus assembly protein FimV